MANTIGAQDVGTKTRVFISYSRKDMAFADRLEAALKARGFEVLIDREEISAFEDWWKRIEALIGRADTVVFVLSPDAIASREALREVEYAASLNKRLAPIVCRRVEDNAVPDALRRLNFIFFDDQGSFDASADKLTEALQTDIVWIRDHTKFGEAARAWVAAERPTGLLLRPPSLEEAEHWIASRPRDAPEPTANTQTFIAESRRAASRRRNLLTGSLAAGVVLALTLAGLAYWQRDVAVQERQVAEEQRRQAQNQRDRALATQSHLLAERSSRLTEQGDTLTAMLLALEAFRGAEWNAPDRYDAGAEKSLADAVYNNHFRSVLASKVGKYVRATFFSNGKYLAATGSDGSVRVWTIGADGRVGAETPFPGNFKLVVGDPTLPILVFEQTDGRYYAWSFATQKSMNGIHGACSKPDDLDLSIDPTGERLSVLCHSLTIFNLKTGEAVTKDKPYSAVAFAGNGKLLTAERKDHSVEILDAQSGQLVHSWKLPEKAESVQMSFDGATVLTATGDGVTLWQSQNGKKLGVRSAQGRIFDVSASPSNDLFATYGDDGVLVWSLGKSAVVQHLDVESNSDPQFLANGVLGVHSEKDVTLWQQVIEGHSATYYPVKRGVLHAPENHAMLAGTADSKELVTLGDSGKLYVWSTGSAMLLDSRKNLDGPFTAMQSSGDGSTVATGLATKALLWRSDSLTPTVTLDATNAVGLLKISADARRILVGSLMSSEQIRPPKNKLAERRQDEPQQIDVYDAATGKHIFPTSTPFQWMGADLSADGKFVLTYTDHEIIRWNVDSDETVHCYLPRVGSAIFGASPDLLYVGGTDMAVRQLQLPTCAATNILSLPVMHNGGLELVHRPGLLMVRETWHGVKDGELLSHMVVWSEGRHAKVIETDKTAWDDLDVSLTGGRIIFAELTSDMLEVFDANGNELLDFQVDWNDCCDSVAIRLNPGTHRFFTGWRERGKARLRAWQWLPSLEALKSYAKELAPECLSPARRKELGIDPEPPSWCIELAKPPYNTQEWKEWLGYMQKNLAPPLPNSPEWLRWRAAEDSGHGR